MDSIHAFHKEQAAPAKETAHSELKLKGEYMNTTKAVRTQLRLNANIRRQQTLHCLINRFRQFAPGFGERPLSLDDLHTACDRHGFEILEKRLPASVSGLSFYRTGMAGMILDSKTTEQERIFLGFHELGHLIFHLPAGLTHSSPQIGKLEQEANTMGVLALMPESRGLSARDIMARYAVRPQIAEVCASVALSWERLNGPAVCPPNHS